MNFLRSKTKTAVIALFLISAFAISLIASTSGDTMIWNGVEYTNIQPSGSIRLPPGVTPEKEYDVVVRLNIAPNPVQINQTVLINGWLSPAISPARYHTDYEFKVTKPDGTVETYLRDSFRADGTAYFTMTPDQLGNWTVKFNFQGSYWPAGNYTYPEAQGGYPVSFPYSVYFTPNSKTMQFTVQEEPLPSWPGQPLPTDYWTRPVGPDQREWWPVLGWYPADGVTARTETEDYWPNDTNRYAQSIYGFIPFTQAALSAHVVHIRDNLNMIGGMMGADLTTNSWGWIDRQYSQVLRPKGPNIIYGGVAYEYHPISLNTPPRDSQVAREFPDSPYGAPDNVFEAYDLRTGKILFQRYDVTQPPTRVTYWEGFPEIEGSLPLYSRYVWLTYVGDGRLINYDPFTGSTVHNISIAPLSTGVLYTHKEDPFFAGAGRVPFFLSVQNLGSSVPASQRYRLIEWTAVGTPFRRSALHDVKLRVVSNVTWPWSNLGDFQDFETMTAFRDIQVTSEYTTGIAPPGSGGAAGSPDDNIIEAASMTTGQLLWSKSTGIYHENWPSGNIADHGKVAFRYTDGYYYVVDQQTGDLLWRNQPTSEPWGYFPDYGIGSYGGNIIVGQADGIAAYDWETGDIAWFFQATQPYPAESVYGSGTPFFGGGPLIADGVVYYANAIHTAKQPLPRGWKLYAVNATTGEYIWSIAGTRSHQQGSTFIDPLSISDGYLAFPNGADGRTYIIGKGQSKTTVSAPQSGVKMGDSITISGTVTDLSPAQPDTPTIADEYQGSWMEYLHMNYPVPANATGVPVTIDVIDANGNYRNIGTATSDTNGNFGLAWKPDIPGFYQVIATFAGSNSYGSSHSMTYFNVEEAPIPTSAPTPTPAQMTDTYVAGFGIAIIIAIVVVGILVIVLRRK